MADKNDIELGSVYKTGDVVPVSGVYRFVKSSDPDCEPTEEALEVPLSRGERFPPHRRCHGAEEWEFIRKAWVHKWKAALLSPGV